MIDSQGMSEVLEMVTKSAVKKDAGHTRVWREGRGRSPSQAKSRPHVLSARRPVFPR